MYVCIYIYNPKCSAALQMMQSDPKEAKKRFEVGRCIYDIYVIYVYEIYMICVYIHIYLCVYINTYTYICMCIYITRNVLLRYK
jgi:hypothetical protein